MLNIAEENWSPFFESLSDDDTASILVALTRPKSRGRIQLRSSDPTDHPIIDPRYYSHPEDGKVMLEAIRFAEKIIQTHSMRKMNTSMPSIPFPPCKAHPIGSDSHWQCFIDHLSFTVYHPVGTCKMGPLSDPEAVVDSQLR